jgi:putative transposase
MVKILREGDKTPLAEVAKKHGVSEGDAVRVAKAVWDHGRARREAPEGPEAENGRLKRLVAERDLEIQVMKEIAAKKW